MNCPKCAKQMESMTAKVVEHRAYRLERLGDRIDWEDESGDHILQTDTYFLFCGECHQVVAEHLNHQEAGLMVLQLLEGSQ